MSRTMLFQPEMINRTNRYIFVSTESLGVEMNVIQLQILVAIGPHRQTDLKDLGHLCS